MRSKDKILEAIITIIENATEPLETKEIEKRLPKETRAKILLRLRNLQGEGLIKGEISRSRQRNLDLVEKRCSHFRG